MKSKQYKMVVLDKKRRCCALINYYFQIRVFNLKKKNISNKTSLYNRFSSSILAKKDTVTHAFHIIIIFHNK